MNFFLALSLCLLTTGFLEFNHGSNQELSQAVERNPASSKLEQFTKLARYMEGTREAVKKGSNKVPSPRKFGIREGFVFFANPPLGTGITINTWDDVPRLHIYFDSTIHSYKMKSMLKRINLLPHATLKSVNASDVDYFSVPAHKITEKKLQKIVDTLESLKPRNKVREVLDDDPYAASGGGYYPDDTF